MFKIKKVKPLFTGVITTATRYQFDGTTDGGIVLMNKMEGQINPFQRVVAAGRTCTDIKEGDIVKLNFNRYMQARHTPGVLDETTNTQADNMKAFYSLPSIDIDGKEYLFMQYNDIEYVVEECEVDDGGLLQ